MKAILKAFRDALVADGTLTGLVAATSIYAGLRDEKTSIPAIDIFQVSEVTEKLAGAAVGGETIASVVMQVSIFQRTEDDAQTIADQVMNVLLGDNSTLNTAKIKNVTLTGKTAMLENNVNHISLRFRCNYMFTT